MLLEDLAGVLEQALPGKVTYHAWPAGNVPALPYICFFTTGTDNFGADNIVYSKRTFVRVELYTKQKDEQTEAAVENALQAAGLFWEREDLYLDDEKCYEMIYEVTI